MTDTEAHARLDLIAGKIADVRKLLDAIYGEPGSEKRRQTDLDGQTNARLLRCRLGGCPMKENKPKEERDKELSRLCRVNEK